MEVFKDIFDFTKSQEAAFNTPIQIADGWTWGFKEHVRKTVLYKNSQLLNGKGQFTPVENIIRPILNLHYRAEGFDVKDIILYVDSAKDYYKSFFIKKFHEKWARENGLDTFIDTMVESYVDFGGALIKNIDDVKPEVVPLQNIVFCDQTDMLSGPIGIKHFFSPDQLLEMVKAGWGEESNGATASLKETIRLSREEKRQAQETHQSKTPGKYIEVYEVHGQFPQSFLGQGSSDDYSNQLHIICFYEKAGRKEGIILFRSEEKQSPFKLIKRDPIHGRCLGFGGAEELEEPQVWTNYALIRETDMMDAASKTLLVTGDSTLAAKHPTGLKNVDNMELLTELPNSNTRQLDTFPRNINLFKDYRAARLDHAQRMGSAQEAIMGEQPNSGTPFKSVEFQAMENHSLHEYRKGKLATFLDEVYRDWIIPYIAREVSKGQEFLAELDIDEMKYVSDALVDCEANKLIKEKILNGELIEQGEVDGYKELIRTEFKKKGTKHYVEILKGEMKSAPISVKTNIAGKQKYLGQTVDKIVNIIRFVTAGNPMALSSPAIWELINQVIEKSGLDPVDFSEVASSFAKMAQTAQQPAQPEILPAQQSPQLTYGAA